MAHHGEIAVGGERSRRNGDFALERDSSDDKARIVSHLRWSRRRQHRKAILVDSGSAPRERRTGVTALLMNEAQKSARLATTLIRCQSVL
jgi:hypothetical protein